MSASRRTAKKMAQPGRDAGRGLGLMQTAVDELVCAVGRSRLGVDQRVLAQIESLSTIAAKASAKIVHLHPEDITGWRLEAARKELDAVIQHTEEAASNFLSAAEELDAIADTLPPKKAELLRNVTTQMYETSTFQDISGQRLNNAKQELANIDKSVAGLLKAIGHETRAVLPASDKVRSEADLLNGPQFQDAATSQEDVDALLESFD